MENRAFYKAMTDAVDRALPDSMTPEYVKFASAGELVTNNWNEAQNGEGYSSRLSEERRSALLGFARDVLAPRVQATFEDFSQRYGWGDPGQLSFSGKSGSDAAGSGRAGGVAGQEVRPGSVDVVGTHFSTQQRTRLDGRYYGRGLKGAERARLEQAADPRIKERVYMYVDEGAGVRPESGVGGYAHRVDGRNLYDMGKDPQRLGRADGNAMESAILDAGFDGYYVPKVFNNQGVAVIMGKASHNVAATPLQTGATSAGVNAPPAGQEGRGATQSRKEGSTYVLKPKGGSEELQMIRARKAIEAAAPSYTLQYGEHRVDEAHREAANQALADAGSELRFSSKLHGQVEAWANRALRGEQVEPHQVALTHGTPSPAFTMFGFGKSQPVVLDFEHVRHIRNSHPDTTGADIAGLLESLKHPRAMWLEPGRGHRISAIVNQRDSAGKPMKVIFEKSEIRTPTGRAQQVVKIADVVTMYGLGDSVRQIVELAKTKTAALWLPLEEVSRVEGFTAGQPVTHSNGDQPSVAYPRPRSIQAQPEERSAGRPGAWRPSTELSVLSDDALAKFQSASNGRSLEKMLPELPRTPLNVDPKVDLSGINFSPKQSANFPTPPEETKLQRGRSAIQDQHLRMKVLHDWATEQGVRLSVDPYKVEERMHGRTATRMEDFREKTVRPIIEAAQKAGYTMADVAQVLHAQHAEERNKQIAKINPKMPDGGSGMSTADARAIMAKAPAELLRLANRLQAITNDTAKVLLQGGIISQDTVDAWNGAYKHYVPLKGGDEDEAAKRGGTGQGLSVNGKSKRALGHDVRDEHIVENILRDHERAILLAEKNRVGQATMLWLTEMANPNVGTVGQPTKRGVLMNGSSSYEVRAAGLVVDTFDTRGEAEKFIRQQQRVKSPGANKLVIREVTGDPMVRYMARPMLEENEAQVYVNGYAIRMQFNDERLADAYRHLNSEQMQWFIASARAVNTYLSKAYTGYNPAFIPRNAIRDFGSGVINLTGKFGAGTTAKIVAKYPAALAQLFKYSWSGKSTPLIDAYRNNGGSTGAAYLSDLQRIGESVQTDYENYQGAIAMAKQGRKWAPVRIAASKLIGGLASWIEHMNMATENAMRLATFEQIRTETGSVEQAASAAKNVTVNFNRRGESGATLGALYLFFNPAVQGTATMMDTLANGKHKHQARALAASMGAVAYMLAATQFGGGDDDYERWKKLNENDRDKNLIIRTGEDTHISIPLSQEYGFFYRLGNAAFMAQKGEDMNKLSLYITSSLFEGWSPIGNPLQGAKRWDDIDPMQFLVTATPGLGAGELARDAARVAVNKSSFGSSIVPDSKFDQGRPDFLRLNRGTKGTAYDWVARNLNQATGGTPTQSGAIDMSPEVLKFWTSAITGGTGGFISDIAHLSSLGVRAAVSDPGEDISSLKPEKSEIPILRDYLKEEKVQDQRRAFWDAANEAKRAMEDFQRAVKAKDVEGKEMVLNDSRELLGVAKASEGYGRMVKALRDRVDQINADETTSLAYKRAAIKQLETEEGAVYDRFLRMVTAAEHRREERKAANQ